MTLQQKLLPLLTTEILRCVFIFITLGFFTCSSISQTADSIALAHLFDPPKMQVTGDSFSVKKNIVSSGIFATGDAGSTKINDAKAKKVVKADTVPTNASKLLLPDSVPNFTAIDTSKLFLNKKSLSIGLNFAFVNGVGIDASYRFANRWSVRASANLAGFTYKNYKYSLKPKASDSTAASTTPQTFSFDFVAKMSSATIGIEYAMGKKGKFRIMTGLAYYPSNYLAISGKLATVYHFHEVDLSSDDLGSGTITIGFKNQIAPYFGFGIGRLYPLKRLNISVDAGAIYKGDYKIGILVNEGALIQKSNEDNAAILQNNLNAHQEYKFWPNFNLRIGYRIF